MNFDKTLLQEFNLKSFRNAKNAQLNIGKDVGAWCFFYLYKNWHFGMSLVFSLVILVPVSPLISY